MNHIKKQRQPVACYTRTCGWYVPMHASNPGKQEEYKDRVTYDKK